MDGNELHDGSLQSSQAQTEPRNQAKKENDLVLFSLSYSEPFIILYLLQWQIN